jgi:hypothetical protein
VDWFEAGVCVGFRDDASDEGLIQVCRDVAVDKVGIDCPFGWPAPFVAAITAHTLGQAWPGRGHPDPALIPTMKFQPGALAFVVGNVDAFDALICAITARAVATGRTILPVTDEEVGRASIEGCGSR